MAYLFETYQNDYDCAYYRPARVTHVFFSPYSMLPIILFLTTEKIERIETKVHDNFTLSE